MILNLVKCVFGVAAKKFLGFMVTERGIEANPNKIRALIEMKSPRDLKEIQKLTGKGSSLKLFCIQGHGLVPSVLPSHQEREKC